MGEAGTILATTNGGESWQAQYSTAETSGVLSTVACADTTHAWAVGTGGTILATTTSGRVSPTIGFRVSSPRRSVLKLGKRLTASTQVQPGSLAGSRVTLSVQRKVGARWRKVTSLRGTIGVECTCSWRYRPTRRGAYRLRVTLAETSWHAAAATGWWSVKVK